MDVVKVTDILYMDTDSTRRIVCITTYTPFVHIPHIQIAYIFYSEFWKNISVTLTSVFYELPFSIRPLALTSEPGIKYVIRHNY